MHCHLNWSKKGVVHSKSQEDIGNKFNDILSILKEVIIFLRNVTFHIGKTFEYPTTKRTADSGVRGCVPLALHTQFFNTLNELIFAAGCKPDAFEPTLRYIASINNHQEQEYLMSKIHIFLFIEFSYEDKKLVANAEEMPTTIYLHMQTLKKSWL